MPPTPSKSGDSSALWKISGLGVELAGSIIGMVLLGWGLDHWLGTSPRWTLIGAGVGVLGGGYNFIRAALRMNKEATSAYKREHPHGPKPVSPPADPETEASAETIRQRLSDFERDMQADLKKARQEFQSRGDEEGRPDER